MPIPRPSGTEAESKFMSRCMGDSVMQTEYPDVSQRAAICHSRFRKSTDDVEMMKALEDILDIS